jgi:hypothetical protein
VSCSQTARAAPHLTQPWPQATPLTRLRLGRPTTARDDGRSDTGVGRGDRRAKDDHLGVQRGKKSIVQGSSHEYANLMMRP